MTGVLRCCVSNQDSAVHEEAGTKIYETGLHVGWVGVERELAEPTASAPGRTRSRSEHGTGDASRPVNQMWFDGREEVCTSSVPCTITHA